jgi:hypothetical protein
MDKSLADVTHGANGDGKARASPPCVQRSGFAPWVRWLPVKVFLVHITGYHWAAGLACLFYPFRLILSLFRFFIVVIIAKFEPNDHLPVAIETPPNIDSSRGIGHNSKIIK